MSKQKTPIVNSKNKTPLLALVVLNILTLGMLIVQIQEKNLFKNTFAMMIDDSRGGGGSSVTPKSDDLNKQLDFLIGCFKSGVSENTCRDVCNSRFETKFGGGNMVCRDLTLNELQELRGYLKRSGARIEENKYFQRAREKEKR